MNGAFPDYLTLGPQQWWGVTFVTDNNVYALNSVTVRVSANSLTPVVWSGSLYSGLPNVTNTPLEQLGGFSTTALPTPADVAFSSVGTVLLASTRYTFVFSTDTPVSVLYYGAWQASGQWATAYPYQTYGFSVFSQNQGSSWTGFGPPMAFAVDASVVPEPSSFALFLAGVLAFSLCHFHRQGSLAGHG